MFYTGAGADTGTGKQARLVGIVGQVEPARTDEERWVGGSLSSPLCLKGMCDYLISKGVLGELAWGGGGRSCKTDQVRDDPSSLANNFLIET